MHFALHRICEKEIMTHTEMHYNALKSSRKRHSYVLLCIRVYLLYWILEDDSNKAQIQTHLASINTEYDSWLKHVLTLASIRSIDCSLYSSIETPFKNSWLTDFVHIFQQQSHGKTGQPIWRKWHVQHLFIYKRYSVQNLTFIFDVSSIFPVILSKHVEVLIYNNK